MYTGTECQESQQNINRKEEGVNENLAMFRNEIEVQVAREFFVLSPSTDDVRRERRRA